MIDVVLFIALQAQWGITAANGVSTSAGMIFSFVANGLFTFGSRRITGKQVLLFLGTTGATMWVVQPVVIHAVLPAAQSSLLAKLIAIGCCLVLNFTAYRFVVWPDDTGAQAPRVDARVR